MDEKEIKKILSIFKKNPFLSEMEVEESGRKIRLKRGAASSSPDSLASPVIEKHQAKETPEKTKSDHSKNLLNIESPMVGTFYRSPSPNFKPFMEAGDTVRKGDVVCIIEAMKLMNEIESDVDGTIVKILPKNGKPVEYGEPLFLVEPL